MKKILIIFATCILATSVPMHIHAYESNKKTVTGKSSWTILKGVAKIVIGAPLALGGFKGFLACIPLVIVGAADKKNNDDTSMLALGIGGAGFSVGCIAGGGYLTYSGIQDLNEEEYSEDNGAHPNYLNGY